MSVRAETRIPIRIFNAFSARFGLNGSRSIHPDDMLKTAARRCGRDDFGDNRFLEGFYVLCKSLNQDAHLHAFGKIISKNYILNSLHNRLELYRRWQGYPEVLEKPISAPVFIVGPGRSGTTLLFNLLALDHRFRFFQRWQAKRPGILPDNQQDVTAAKKKCAAEWRMMNYISPGLDKVHHLAPEKPEECTALLINSFESVFFRNMFRVDTYYDWYNEQDHTYAYSYYKKQLQWLQRKSPGKRWLLKAPSHLMGTKALLDEFPDAVIIKTHRDPVESIPSSCSLKYHLQRMMSYKIDKKEIGEFVMKDQFHILTAACNLPAEKQLDIFYENLVSHPITVLKEIYQSIGKKFDDTLQRRALKYLASNAKDKFGRHHYSLQEFGLDRRTILDNFDFYYQRYGLGQYDRKKKSIV